MGENNVSTDNFLTTHHHTARDKTATENATQDIATKMMYQVLLLQPHQRRWVKIMCRRRISWQMTVAPLATRLRLKTRPRYFKTMLHRIFRRKMMHQVLPPQATTHTYTVICVKTVYFAQKWFIRSSENCLNVVTLHGQVTSWFLYSMSEEHLGERHDSVDVHLSDGLDSGLQKVPVALGIAVHQNYISANCLIVLGRRWSVFVSV